MYDSAAVGRWRRWITLAFVTGLVAVSLIPEPWKNHTSTSGYRHDGAHVIAFALTLAIAAGGHARLARIAWFGAGLLTLAVTLEFLQTAEFGNRFEFRDVLDDGIGIVCGMLMVTYMKAKTGMMKAKTGMMKTKTAYSTRFFDVIQDGSTRSARIVLPIVFDLLEPSSVIDIGCGRGAWLRVAAELGVDEIAGLDGSYVDRSDLLIPPDRFRPTDLSAPFTVPQRYDLALCLEVAEHLPKRSSASLVDALVSAGEAVLFSAAIPGQMGSHHVNEQFPEFWWRLFRERGFVALDVVRPRIAWDERVEVWYAQNVLLYVAEDLYRRSARLQQYTVVDEERLLPWVHSGIWRGRMGWRGPASLVKMLLGRWRWGS